MHGSYFHHLFLVCIWLSVKAPQVGCDAVSINGQQDRAAANQCWEKCSLAANVSRSAAKALESPETCYKECLKKSRSHQFAGNEQDKALSRRIKREDDCVNNYSDPLPKEDINVTVEYIPFARGLHPFFNATISWSVSSDLTSNLTQGYMVSYGLPNKDRLDCRRVLGMSTFFTGFNIETEDPAKKFPLYVKVYPLSRDENRKGKQWKIVSFSMDTNLTSRVWKGKECDELAETKDFLRKEDIQIELILSTGGYYNTIISWNLQSVQSDWGHMIVYELDGLVNDTRTPTFCRAVKKGRNSTRFDVRNKLLLANRSRIRVAVTSLSPKRVRNGSQYQIANFSDARPKGEF